MDNEATLEAGVALLRDFGGTAPIGLEVIGLRAVFASVAVTDLELFSTWFWGGRPSLGLVGLAAGVWIWSVRFAVGRG